MFDELPPGQARPDDPARARPTGHAENVLVAATGNVQKLAPLLAGQKVYVAARRKPGDRRGERLYQERFGRITGAFVGARGELRADLVYNAGHKLAESFAHDMKHNPDAVALVLTHDGLELVPAESVGLAPAGSVREAVREASSRALGAAWSHDLAPTDHPGTPSPMQAAIERLQFGDLDLPEPADPRLAAELGELAELPGHTPARPAKGSYDYMLARGFAAELGIPEETDEWQFQRLARELLEQPDQRDD
jgi:hypothetical protein